MNDEDNGAMSAIGFLKELVKKISENSILSSVTYALSLSFVAYLYNWFGMVILSSFLGLAYFFYHFLGLVIVPLLALLATYAIAVRKSFVWFSATVMMSYVFTFLGMLILCCQIDVYFPERGVWGIAIDMLTSFNPLGWYYGVSGFPVLVYAIGLAIRIYWRSIYWRNRR